MGIWGWVVMAGGLCLTAGFTAWALCYAAAAGDAELEDLVQHSTAPPPSVDRSVAHLAPGVERIVALAATMLGADVAAVVLEDGGWSSTGERLAAGEEPHTLLTRPSVAAAAPVRPNGCLHVISGEPGRRFEGRELELIGILADAAAAALAAPASHGHVERVSGHIEQLAASLEPSRAELRWRGGDFVALVAAVGRRMGLDRAERAELELAARLLDIGLLRVPTEVLDRPGRLTDAEWSVVRRHPVWGADALVGVPGLAAVAFAVRCHHERWDGGGYPHGLAGPRIPAAARVLAACDAWWAMTSQRPYAPALSPAEAAMELRLAAGGQLDPAAVDAVLAEVAAAAVVVA
jgi:hypothetical protein